MATSPQQDVIEHKRKTAAPGEELWSSERTVTTTGDSASVTVPPEALEVLGIAVGDAVTVSVSEGSVTITPRDN